MNAKKIIPNEIEMKPKLTKSKRNCFPKNIRNVGERISGGYVVVVVGKERQSNGKEGIFHQGAHLHTHIGAHTYTHIHDKGGGGWDGESFPRVKVYTQTAG